MQNTADIADQHDLKLAVYVPHMLTWCFISSERFRRIAKASFKGVVNYQYVLLHLMFIESGRRLVRQFCS